MLDADGNATWNLFAWAAQQFPQGLPFLDGLRIPQCVFKRRLGHAVTSDLGIERRTLSRRFNFTAEQRGSKIVRNGRPCTVDPLAAVKGIFCRNAFGPAIHAVTVDGNEENTTMI